MEITKEVYATYRGGQGKLATFTFSGLNYEAKIEVVQSWWDDTVLLLRVPGRKTWSSIGSHNYASPIVIVVEVIEKTAKWGKWDASCKVRYLYERDSTRANHKQVWDDAQAVIRKRIAELEVKK